MGVYGFQLLPSDAYFVKRCCEDDVGSAHVVDQDPVKCFDGHDDPYYQRVDMGMLESFHVRVREVSGGIKPREVGHGLYLQCLP